MRPKHSGAAKMWLLNLVGNAALVACVYFWLLLPDAHGWQVAGSGLLAILVIFCGVWLRTGSFAYFRIAEFREHATVGRAFRHALRHLVALAFWAILFGCFALCLLWMHKYTPQFGVWFWQKLPAGLRVGSPRQMMHAADWLLCVIFGLALMTWLPMASTVSAVGLKTQRMARSARVLKRASYWLWFWTLAIIGVYIPYKLVWWIPDLATLRQQAWSAGLRLSIAYVVFISTWVAMLLVVGEWAEKQDPDPIPDLPSSGVDRTSATQ